MRIIKRLMNKVRGGDRPTVSFHGKYSNFSEALKQTTSYNAQVITDKVEERAKAFKKEDLGKDLGVILSDYGALFSVLTKIHGEKGNSLKVVDFGGSGGYFYFQLKNFLGDRSSIGWTVVELAPVAEIGKKYYANNELSFETDFDKAVDERKPDVLLISGTIQYLNEPFAFLDKAISKGIEYIVIDRSPFTQHPAYVQVQQVRKPIYDASFPIHIMNYNEFVHKLSSKYKLWFRFPSVDKKIGEADALGMVFIKK